MPNFDKSIILKAINDYFCMEIWDKMYYVDLIDLSLKPFDWIKKMLEWQNIILKKLLIYEEKLLKDAYNIDQVI